jgi:hypothetical protein
VNARSVARIWTAFWFAPDSPQQLAIVRILVAAHALWILRSRDFASSAGLPDYWASVPASLRWRYLLFPGHATLEHVLQVTATVAVLAALFGIVTRPACLIAGVLLYHLAPLDVIFWSPAPTARGLTLSPILLLILAAAPSGDAWALWPRTGRTTPSGEYGWPRRLTWLLVAEVYLFAAIAKATQSGLAWSGAGNLRRWLLLFTLGGQWPRHALGRWIADRPLWCLAIGIGTVIFEWTFILAVCSRRARRVLVPAGLVLQIGILLAMNIQVGETWLILTFVDWPAVMERVRGAWRRRPGPSYDATTRSIARAPSSGEAASSA